MPGPAHLPMLDVLKPMPTWLEKVIQAGSSRLYSYYYLGWLVATLSLHADNQDAHQGDYLAMMLDT